MRFTCTPVNVPMSFGTISALILGCCIGAGACGGADDTSSPLLREEARPGSTAVSEVFSASPTDPTLNHNAARHARVYAVAIEQGRGSSLRTIVPS